MSKAASLKYNKFGEWLFHLDRILRGEATKPSDIKKADIKMPLFGIALLVFLLAAIYGFCMGVFALVSGFENETYQRAMLQTFASMCKVPLLFFLTLVVTFPSLYVFNALVGSKLRGIPVLKLLIASLAVNLSVLASMGPILAFFSVSTPNYHFIVLLNVVVFAIAGVLGLVFLIQTLNRLSNAQKSATRRAMPPATTPPGQAPSASPTATSDGGTSVESVKAPGDVVQATAVDYYGDEARGPQAQKRQKALSTIQSTRQSSRPGPLDHLDGVVLGHHVRKVFCCWIVVFGLVGAQMGWVLRPFIGAPETEFSWFRVRSSNFFEAVANTFYNLMF